MIVAGTRAPDASRSSIVLAEIVDAVIVSVKVAVTALVTATPPAPLTGVTALTFGGVVSPPAGLNTRSTQ